MATKMFYFLNVLEAVARLQAKAQIVEAKQAKLREEWETADRNFSTKLSKLQLNIDTDVSEDEQDQQIGLENGKQPAIEPVTSNPIQLAVPNATSFFDITDNGDASLSAYTINPPSDPSELATQSKPVTCDKIITAEMKNSSVSSNETKRVNREQAIAIMKKNTQKLNGALKALRGKYVAQLKWVLNSTKQQAKKIKENPAATAFRLIAEFPGRIKAMESEQFKNVLYALHFKFVSDIEWSIPRSIHLNQLEHRINLLSSHLTPKPKKFVIK